MERGGTAYSTTILYTVVLGNYAYDPPLFTIQCTVRQDRVRVSVRVWTSQDRTLCSYRTHNPIVTPYEQDHQKLQVCRGGLPYFGFRCGGTNMVHVLDPAQRATRTRVRALALNEVLEYVTYSLFFLEFTDLLV